jgi:predicted transcriptional regulator
MARKPKNIPAPRPLRQIRDEEKHWSIETLSRLARVDRKTIWGIERGHQVAHKSTAKRIADALGLKHPSEVTEFAAIPTSPKGHDG